MLKGIHIASKHDQNISWSSHNVLLYHVASFQKQNTFCCALLDYKLINDLTSSSHTSYLKSTYPPHPHRVWQKCCQIHQLHGLARPAAVSSKTSTPGHRLMLKQQFQGFTKEYGLYEVSLVRELLKVCYLQYVVWSYCMYIYIYMLILSMIYVASEGWPSLLKEIDDFFQSRQNMHPIPHFLMTPPRRWCELHWPFVIPNLEPQLPGQNPQQLVEINDICKGV